MEKDFMKKKFGLPPMPPIGPKAPAKRNFQRKRDYSLVDWGKYFQKQFYVNTEDGDNFCVYSCGTEGPVVLFLHGGGFSALSWALLSASITSMVQCQCIAVDQRGHGGTRTANDSDLSAEQLSSDIGKLVAQLYPDGAPPIILVGHSMGGAIAVHIAEKKLIPSLVGLAVIDVVEGTAMDALSSMQSFLRNRPSRFKSIDMAIEWAVRSGQIQNVASAKVSMIGQLKSISPTSESSLSQSFTDAIREEDEEQEGGTSSVQSMQNLATLSSTTTTDAQATVSTQYTWRIDLSETDVYWRGWFTGLSQKFLSCSPAKVLILAGTDRLDKDLTIGQMQGKFQLNLLPQSGHAVHEDVPDKVADILVAFMIRQKVAEPIDDFNRPVPGC